MTSTPHYAYPEIRPGRWRDVSRHLAEFRGGDFRHVWDDWFPILYERTWRARLRRPVPHVSATARELAPHYDHPPTRTYRGDARSAEAVRQVIRALGGDRIMLRMSRRLITQGTQIGLWWPEAPFRWRLLLCDPWQCEVDPDPYEPTRIERVRRIALHVPIEATHDRVIYGRITIDWERREAWIERRGERPAGVYAPDGSIPFSRPPVFVARLGEPEPGDFFGPLPFWLYEQTVSLCCAYSDIEYAARFGSHGQPVAYGLSKAQLSELGWGPGTVAGHPGTKAEGAEIEILRAGGDVEQYLRAVSGYEDAIRLAEGLQPRELGGHAVTAAAKQIELWDRDQARAHITDSLREAEQDLVDSAVSVLGWDWGSPFARPLEPVYVDIEYHHPAPPADPLHTAQANRMLYEDGVILPGDTVASGTEMDRDRGQEVAEANQARYAQMRRRLGTMPGTTPPESV